MYYKSGTVVCSYTDTQQMLLLTRQVAALSAWNDVVAAVLKVDVESKV